MPPVSSAESNMESAPRRNPNVGPMTRAARMSANHIGSIPIAPIPRGRNAATSALRIPRKATFFDPRSSDATIEIKSKTVKVVDAKKNQLAQSACLSLATKKGQQKPRKVEGMRAAIATARRDFTRKNPVIAVHLPL
jgi:hypothetical protein